MSVLTKNPAGRGTATAPAGPIPAPRVVGNRRVRGGGVALAVMLLALGAALSGIALVSVSHTAAYLAVARPVAVGSPIAAADLTTVELGGGHGLTPIPATAINAVIGKRAAVSLVPGTLLAPGQLTDRQLIGTDQAQIGIGVRNSYLPSVTLNPGDQVLLVAISTGTGTGGAINPRQFPATIIDVGRGAQGATVVLHVAVAADAAPTIVSLNASGGLGVVLRPTGN